MEYLTNAVSTRSCYSMSQQSRFFWVLFVYFQQIFLTNRKDNRKSIWNKKCRRHCLSSQGTDWDVVYGPTSIPVPQQITISREEQNDRASSKLCFLFCVKWPLNCYDIIVYSFVWCNEDVGNCKGLSSLHEYLGDPQGIFSCEGQ